MPFKRKRPELSLHPDSKIKLEQISKSSTEKAGRVNRAKMILAYSRGVTISAIARQLSTNRPKINRCIDKAFQLGPLTALNDLPRSGKPPEITPEARTWLINVAETYARPN